MDNNAEFSFLVVFGCFFMCNYVILWVNVSFLKEEYIFFLALFTCASFSHFTRVNSDDLHSLLSSRFPPHMVPPHHSLHTTGIPHPAIVTPNVKQESTHSDINSLNSSWVASILPPVRSQPRRTGAALTFPPSCPPQETVRLQEGTGEKERGPHKETPERLHAVHEGNAGQGGGGVYTEGKRRHQPNPGAEGKIGAGFWQGRTRLARLSHRTDTSKHISVCCFRCHSGTPYHGRSRPSITSWPGKSDSFTCSCIRAGQHETTM